MHFVPVGREELRYWQVTTGSDGYYWGCSASEDKARQLAALIGQAVVATAAELLTHIPVPHKERMLVPGPRAC